jgi:hypothetical protein
MNTRNPGKIMAIGVTVRAVGVVRGYFLNILLALTTY